MPAVQSRAISFIDYDPVSKVLVITFVKSGKYDFPNFPLKLYEEFLQSKSKGKFYNLYIKGKF
ncbi:KTSC domain-containing protein [Litorimonas sp.]|uniref:KTSC domain-containing protein n=1 Tax=Litorimonas sp. TaxID=1892381 RepID=UPI003A8B7140